MAPSLTTDAVPVNLTVDPSGFALSPLFWGTTVSAEAGPLPDNAQLLNATPTRVLVWPGANAGDRLNELNDTLLTVRGSKLIWSSPPTNESQFIAECRAIDCVSILQVPGEIDDPSTAAAIVNYTERTLGFVPDYWEIGNEPERWTHWGLPWNEWNQPPQGTGSRITPGQYAWEVHNYTAVMRTADPSIRILGLPGTGRPQYKIPLSEWLNTTIAVNGPNLAGIAFHVYTAGTKGAPTPQQFYAYDTGPYSLVGRLQDARSTISSELNATCPACAAPPIFVTEFGSALSHYRYGELSRGFAGALSLTATEIEGMEMNVTNMDGFASVFGTSNSWLTLNGTPRPAYTVYGQFLSHLGSEVYPVSFQVPNGPGYTGSNSSLSSDLYGVATRTANNEGRSDLLLVNVNTSSSVSLDPTLPGVGSGAPTELYEWQGQLFYSASNGSYWSGPVTPNPVDTFFPTGIPSGWTLPPQTLALFESYPGPVAPVVFASSGLPAPTRWFLSVDGALRETAAANLTVLLPGGTHTLAPVASPLPLGENPKILRERLESFPPASVSVSTSPLTVPVPFDAQWALRLSTEPPGKGTLASWYPWANASVPTLLSAVPASGYVVSEWLGSGHGSYTGRNVQARVVPKDPVNETVVFAEGFDVTFDESGLPVGSSWGVSVDGSTVSSTGASVDFLEANGTFLYQPTAVAGYTLAAGDSWVVVSGQAVMVTVQYVRISSEFEVVWEETGLTHSVPWRVVVDGSPYNASGAWTTVDLVNGTYLFSIPPIDGWIPTPSSGDLRVDGAPIVVPVTFSQPTFLVLVNSTGLPPGTVWSVNFSGRSASSSTSGLEAELSNGSYVWKVDAPTGYAARTDSGKIVVSGRNVYFSVSFYASASALAVLSQDPIEPLAIIATFAVACAMAWLVVSWRVHRRRPPRPTVHRPPPSAPRPSSAPPAATRSRPVSPPPSAPSPRPGAPPAPRQRLARYPPGGPPPS